jgi:protocatechuate 3,4-dioxygenase beta subunit
MTIDIGGMTPGQRAELTTQGGESVEIWAADIGGIYSVVGRFKGSPSIVRYWSGRGISSTGWFRHRLILPVPHQLTEAA